MNGKRARKRIKKEEEMFIAHKISSLLFIFQMYFTLFFFAYEHDPHTYRKIASSLCIYIFIHYKYEKDSKKMNSLCMEK